MESMLTAARQARRLAPHVRPDGAGAAPAQCTVALLLTRHYAFPLLLTTARLLSALTGLQIGLIIAACIAALTAAGCAWYHCRRKSQFRREPQQTQMHYTVAPPHPVPLLNERV